jgi:hypothetical protein
MASLQPSLGFNVDREKGKMSTDKFCEQVFQHKSFGRPPESVVKSCRARMARSIAANVSETVRQRAIVSPSKKLKKASLIF